MSFTCKPLDCIIPAKQKLASESRTLDVAMSMGLKLVVVGSIAFWKCLLDDFRLDDSQFQEK